MHSSSASADMANSLPARLAGNKLAQCAAPRENIEAREDDAGDGDSDDDDRSQGDGGTGALSFVSLA